MPGAVGGATGPPAVSMRRRHRPEQFSRCGAPRRCRSPAGVCRDRLRRDPSGRGPGTGRRQRSPSAVNVATIGGLPAHVLLVHAVVVFAPVAGVLLVLCAVWPAARRCAVWLAVGLVVVTAALTPLTIDAGQWLQNRLGAPPDVAAHARLGDSMSYVAIALVVGAAAVTGIHVWERMRAPAAPTVRIAVAVVTVAIGVGTVIQVYRIGDSGARAAWADQISATAPADPS